MTVLEDFIVAADQLMQFQSALQEIPLVDKTLTSLEASKSEIKDLWSKIKTCYALCLRDNECEDQEAIKTKYRMSSTTYINCLSEVIDSKNKLSRIKEDSDKSSSSAVSNIEQCIKVPPCDTETFYGDYLTWPSFRDMFTAVYINHPKLCPVQKLFHLRSKTKGEANNIVSKFPLTADNFELAWKALSAQYENRRILVNNQLKGLFNLPVISVESGKGIKDLQREINDCISILKAHKVSVDSWDPILVYLCSNRLPEITLSLWEQSVRNPSDIPTWEEMDIFLTSRYRVLETVSDLKFVSRPKVQQSKGHGSNKHKAFHSKATNFNCKLCKGSHSIRQCQTFLQMSIPDRISKVNLLKVCRNCLASTHSEKDCRSMHTCMQCKQKHHTLLHSTPVQQSPSVQPAEHVQQGIPAPESRAENIQSTANPNPLQFQTFFSRNNKRILLATALIDIHYLGSKFTLRALIDGGSEVTFISEDAQKRLNLPVKPIKAQISGMSAVVTSTSSKLCSLCIGSKHAPSFTIMANAIVLKRLTGDLPSCLIRREEVSEPIDFELADPYFYESTKIDIVIGSDLYPSIIKEGIKSNIFGTLVAQNTIFGWILSGPFSQESRSFYSTVLSHFSEISIDEQIAKFWEVEEISGSKPLSQEDIFCEQLYSKTTLRDDTGRYIVHLPFKNPLPILGRSRDIAFRQFHRMEKTLMKKPELHSRYNQVLAEYVNLGHMQLVSSEEIIQNHTLCSNYLPHHSVIKPDSITTKVRVVFNASNPSSNGISLNDMLYTGPVLQVDLTTLILRWRFYRFVFNADIEKMYRQILVHPEHAAYQRLLFRNPVDGSIQDYELKTVTFGVNCAPYLAIRTLLQLADDVQHIFPLASEILKNDFYVDDVLSGAHDIRTALRSQQQLSDALCSAGFSLRKWTSNCVDLINEFPSSHLYDQDFLRLDDKSISKTLGIQWNAKLDSFHFFFKIFEEDHLLTKRAVLSAIARLFDPAGWLAPIVITAKIIMQQIWRDGTSWDTNLVPLTCRRWKTFFGALPDIQHIKVPRWINYTPSDSIQIHGFCDASELAYAATFYLRIQHSDNNWSCHLLCAKTKVAPVKQLALPRLELCGALLLSKLFHKVITHLKCPPHELFFWTDSSIVLAWLSRPPCTWKTFVGNRVSQIQSNVSTSRWYHVRSGDNPADLATRGLSPMDLKANGLWWHGPSWLCQAQSSWPQTILQGADNILLEQRPIKANFTAIAPNIETIVERFSSWSKTLHTVCYILRFFYRTHPRFRHQFAYSSKLISAEEIANAKYRIIRLTQAFYFRDEYLALSKSEPISKKSHLNNLNTVMDPKQILRSDGRLANSTLSYNERYPILLPYQANISTLLVKFIHDISIHGGNQLVIRLIRCEFWIPKVKNLVKKCIRLCKTCIIHKRKVQTQIMGALPIERTRISSPFTTTGLDFAGPFAIKSFSGRNYRITKGYVCLFVCFATKAIHLEATSDLTTQCFLAALSRFIARRGMPKTLFSDNGTNLVGASKVISKDFKQFLATVSKDVSERYKDYNLEWKFIPPGAPHMGGLWEAGVKSFKLHFRKIAGTHKLTFEEFSTLLSKIEGCLNSRPISPISENASDIPPLTPGHFLRGGPLLAPLEPAVEEKSLSYIKRWERVKILYHKFCRRWKHEYLKELNKRYKWKHPQRNMSFNDLVVIRDENLPPNEWRLGRVVKVFPGSDNRIRVADIRTQNGVITRPIAKLCILPQS